MSWRLTALRKGRSPDSGKDRMVVGLLQMALRLPSPQSLKEKRWVVKSLVTRIQNKFNVSIAEVDFQNVWQKATLAVAHVGNDRAFSNQLLDQVLNFTQRSREIEVIDSQLEFF